MYTTSRNEVNPNRLDVDINGERYWPVKIQHKSTGHTKWVNLYEDEPTVKKRKKARPIKNYCSDQQSNSTCIPKVLGDVYIDNLA